MSKETFDIMKETSYYELLVTLLDNTGDDYPQMGIGQDTNGVYIVDLFTANTETLREKKYVIPGMRAMDVVKVGIKHHLFQENASDDVRYRCDEPLLNERKAFLDEVLIENKRCNNNLDEELEELEENYE